LLGAWWLAFALIRREATLPKSRSDGLAKALPRVADSIEFVGKPSDSVGFAALLVNARRLLPCFKFSVELKT
jgi:hypothetical protein